MKISTKLNGIMLGIILINGLLMFLTISKLNSINSITGENQNKNIPIMITSLSLQKDIIQIQQWLTDISATRGEEGLDDGFSEAAVHYENAKNVIGSLRKLGVKTEVMDSISKNLDEFYQMGIDMANTYINEGTHEGNIFMEKFDPYAEKIEGSVKVLLEQAASFEEIENVSAGLAKVCQELQPLLLKFKI